MRPLSGRLVLDLLLRRGGRVLAAALRHLLEVQAATVRIQYLESETVAGDGLAAARQSAEALHHPAADGIELLVAEVAVEIAVELVARRERLHSVDIIVVSLDVGVFLDVVLVDNLADDLLEHVLNGDEARDAAVFVDDDGHVIAACAEFLEQDVEALALGGEHRGAKDVARVEG